MTAVVLDSEALNVLVRDLPGEQHVREWLVAAHRAGREVTVPAAVLAELYRTAGHEARVDSLLSRQRGVSITDTDRYLARIIGRLLAAAGRGSEDHVDASAVAAAVIKGGGVVLTTDPGDLSAIAAGSAAVSIHKVG